MHRSPPPNYLKNKCKNLKSDSLIFKLLNVRWIKRTFKINNCGHIEIFYYKMLFALTRSIYCLLHPIIGCLRKTTYVKKIFLLKTVLMEVYCTIQILHLKCKLDNTFVYTFSVSTG